MNNKLHITFLIAGTGLVLAIGCLSANGAKKRQPQQVIVELSGVLCGATDYFVPRYMPFDVPKEATKIKVEQSFETHDGSRANIDLGVFDPKGTELNTAGFRGWSGGARRLFEISRADATPGYMPGDIDEGKWNVVQMLTSSADSVFWKLKITITVNGNREDPFIPKYPAAKLNDIPGWYRIDPHVHTFHSDGANSPEEIVALAKAKGLDGIVSADHNTLASLGRWGYCQDSDLLVIPGMEVTYNDGHWNVLGIDPTVWVDFRYPAADHTSYQICVQRAKQAGALVQANHPYIIEFRYDKAPADLIEVWNGGWSEANEKAVEVWDTLLKCGVWKAATCGSDYHRPSDIPPGVPLAPQTVVRATSLSAKDVLEAMAAGRSFLTDRSNLMLEMSAHLPHERTSVADIGDTLRVDNHQTPVVQFAANLAGELHLLTEKGCIYHGSVDEKTPITMKLPDMCRWVRAELRTPEGRMMALTNPIFLEYH